jgi:hypothetical protein
MAFKDNYTAPPMEGGAEFIGKDEKAELIASSVELPVSGVRFKASTKVGWADQYFLDVELDGEKRTLTMACGSGVTTRDDLCEKLRDYFKTDDTPVPIVLRKEGNAVLIDLV